MVKGQVYRKRTSRRLSLAAKEALAGYLCVLLPVIGFFVFLVYPMASSLYFSFTRFRIIDKPVWVGLQNFLSLVKDPIWLTSVRVTIVYAVFSLPLGLIGSLALALLMNRKLKGISFWRTVYYVPSVISGVAVAMLWRWILNPDFGLLNMLLKYIGVSGMHWLGDTRTALPSLIVISLWGIGGGLVIYLAGLQGIPTELYEAAEIDGATAWRKLINVTLPMLSPVMFFNLVMGVIGVFQWFTEPYVITRGGPDQTTLSYMLNLYNNGFKYFEMGYASAMAWILFAAVLVLTVLVFRSSPMWVHYEGERRA
jgi:multiple sugar transport system permease protein